MSKQSEARVSQGYRETSRNCGNCAHRALDMVLPDCGATFYSIERYGVEKNKRCSIGGFAIKNKATCNFHKIKEAS